MAVDERRPVPAGRPPNLPNAPAGCPASHEVMRADWIGFYEGEYPLVVRFVMKYGASLEDARDATEEAFLEAWALLRRKPGQWSQIRDKRGWIRTVALRKHQRPPGPRRRPPTSDTTIPDRAAPGPEPGELTAQTQAVLQALHRLERRAR